MFGAAFYVIVTSGIPDVLTDTALTVSGNSAQISVTGVAETASLRAATVHMARDEGDFLLSGEDRVSLWRFSDQFVVGIEAQSTIDDVFGAMLRANSAIVQYEIVRQLNPTTFMISAKGEGAAEVIDAPLLSGLDGVSWVTPLYQFGSGGSWRAINNEVVVALKPGVTPNDFFGGEFKSWRPLMGTPDQFVAVLADGSGGTALATANRLGADSRVQWAAPNGYSKLQQQFTPNDPLFAQQQWNLDDAYGLEQANAHLAEAWDTTQGDPGVVIAVLDDGVQLSHPDLNIWVNPGEIAGNGLDDDGNGWIDDVNGWNFFASGGGNNNPNPANPLDNHGTAVAGVAAAAGNTIGVSGASRNARIMPIKIAQGNLGTNTTDFASFSQIAEAVYYAAGRTADGLNTWKSADILNMSFADDSGMTSDPILDPAINWAASSGRGGVGASIFAAAGNNAAGTTAPLNYETFKVNLPAAGSYVFEWRYEKDASGNAGSDRAWLANVQMSNGNTYRFTSALSLPVGWSTSGNVGWSVVDDPYYTYGTSRYVAKSGAISNGQTSRIRSPLQTFSGPGYMTFNAFVSSEANHDGLRLYVSFDNGANFSPVSYFLSGVPSVQTVVAYPANLTAPIAVGASTDWDYRAVYSQFGPALDVVAPSSGGWSGIATTDRTGADGYNPTDDYTYRNGPTAFTGTSAAAPLVAGIAALLLTKNPHLTPAQIRTALQSTADKIGGNNGQTAYNTSSFSQYYGYGRVNAQAALASVSVDTIAPKVTNVTIKGLTSPHVPFSFNKPNDSADVDGSGLQLRTVPVGGADTVQITFSEAVSNLTFSSLLLRSVTGGTVQSIAGFEYNPASYVGTWVYANKFAADEFLITLADTVTDAAGNALDGEWKNPLLRSTTNPLVSKFPSGNGTAGGSFSFVFSNLPGDANLDNSVDTADYVSWRYYNNPNITGRFFTQADFNGTGITDGTDYSIWYSNFGKALLVFVNADFNGDAAVNLTDYYIWVNNSGTGTTHFQGDADGDGDVDGDDFLVLQIQFNWQFSWVA